ncbi:MAG: DUF1475 family protein [Holophagaceae bacterium]
MIRALKAWFLLVLLAMLAVTTWAGLQENLFVAGGRLIRDPWGLATLFDAYFAFLAFWLWLAWRERTWLPRILWLLAILALGNLAMAAYVLILLFQLPAGAGPDALFQRRALKDARP